MVLLEFQTVNLASQHIETFSYLLPLIGITIQAALKLSRHQLMGLKAPDRNQLFN